MSLTQTERLEGAGIGQAVGDFIGFQVERTSGDTALAFGCRVFDRPAGVAAVRSPWPLGQVSDDTQLSRVLLSHLKSLDGALDGSRLNAEALARDLASRRNDFVGLGGGTQSVLEDIAGGGNWQEASRLNSRPTNGAAMRVWPLAFAFSGIGLVRSVVEVASITHSHPTAIQAAVAVCASVRHLVEGGSPDCILQGVEDFSRNYGLSVGTQIVRHVRECLAYPGDAGARTWALSGGIDPHWKNVSPLVLPTVAWALYSFVRAEGNFREAVLESLSAGGDVDSIAAIAGTLCGAHGGASVVPDALARLARDGDEWIAPRQSSVAVGQEVSAAPA